MRRPLLFAILGGVAVVVVLAIVGSLLAIQAIDRADAMRDYETATEGLRDAVAATEFSVAEADEVVGLGGDPLVPAEPLALVDTARETAAGARAEADTALAADVDALPTEDVRDATAELARLADALAADAVDVGAALADLVAAVTEGAPAVESANFDANNEPHIAFRSATLGLGSAVDDQVAEYLGAYLIAANDLAASHAAELAEKAGPLFDARMAVQAFAREMANGVLLEFDWAPTVNGYGLNGSYGGTSYWNTADGGQATISLSDSVALQWPGAGVQALVVHEVGHAVLSKAECYPLFFDSEFASGGEEPWATAWAIGLGYTADGSGESIYGRPSDALIALSQQCR